MPYPFCLSPNHGLENRPIPGMLDKRHPPNHGAVMTQVSDNIYELVQLDDYLEGYVKVLDHNLFFRSFGSGKAGTVLCLHGGPGSGHSLGVHMARLAREGYRVVFYDQLGAGRSDSPRDKLLYTVERYVDEAEGVRQALGLGKVHLWGASWGAFLGVAYGVKHSANLKSLMVQSGTSSVPLCRAEFLRLREELPTDVLEMLKKHEARQEYSDPEYLKAVEFVYRKHVCRRDPWPPFMRPLVEGAGAAGTLAYNLMWGENEFLPVGNLLYWDVTSELGKIECPTLVTCGEFDEVTPANSELIHRGVKNSKLVIFKGCSHLIAYEDPEEYHRVHSDFLRSVG